MDHIAAHSDLPDPELAIQIARDVVGEVARVAACSGAVYVISEGNFPLKAPEADRRKKSAESRAAAGDYRAALAIPDCVARLVRAGLTHCDRAPALSKTEWVDLEHTEGEPQLLYMSLA